ncbi:hypothetical protein [Streptomyces mirabilis]|uniref:hypothetical protein n=1 Tax=Streptomyces mirabilis TaxID=68239 RepID=UPI002258F391|nr:hypothetical protein [Streptomyces mirabilis]MCX4433662.1 hypothetical protein [Streptomyces mirabilis]
MTTVTLLHPGAMGPEVGAQAHRAGTRVLHVPTGRGSASVERARKAGLEAAESLGSALAVSDLVLSICPPHAAEDVAREVLEHAFTGVYVEGTPSAPIGPSVSTRPAANVASPWSTARSSALPPDRTAPRGST